MDIFNSFITVYLLVNVESVLASCPTSWVTFDGSCYLFSLDKKTFTDAEHFCNQRGGHILSIETQIEQLFIDDFALNMFHDDYWIDASTYAATDLDNVWKGPITYYPASSTYYPICELSETSRNVIVG